MPDVDRLVDIFIVLERRFDCRFESRESDLMLTVGDLVACIEKNLAAPERVGFW